MLLEVLKARRRFLFIAPQPPGSPHPCPNVHNAWADSFAGTSAVSAGILVHQVAKAASSAGLPMSRTAAALTRRLPPGSITTRVGSAGAVGGGIGGGCEGGSTGGGMVGGDAGDGGSAGGLGDGMTGGAGGGGDWTSVAHEAQQ